MKVEISSIDGSEKGHIELPGQFKEELRPDLIKRAVLAIHSHNKQPYGAQPDAGMRASAKLSRRRRDYKTSYGIGISRVPRKIMSYRGTRFNWVGAFAPNTVGGRRAHPPKATKIWDQKVNKKERRKAIRSALAATVVKELVQKRGHIVDKYPLIVDGIEDISKTKELKKLLVKLGLQEELNRVSSRKIRAGKAKTRGRKYQVKKGPLIVVSKNCPTLKSAKNIPGVEAVIVNELNANLLAPGADYGRLTIYAVDAIKRISDNGLFTDSPKLKIEKETPKKAPTKEDKPKKPAKPKDGPKKPARKVNKKKAELKND